MGDLIELTTPQDEYDFYEVTSAMKFYLKGKGCVCIGLTRMETRTAWIMLGNEYSCKGAHTQQKVETKNMISEHTYKPFWISWYQNKIKVGEGNNPKPFLVGKEFINCNNIEILFSSSETMFWKFRLPHVVEPHKYKRISGGQLKWVKMDGNCLPEDAFIGGYENEVLYIMRVMHEGALTPRKFMPSKGDGYVAWGYDAHKKTDMEIGALFIFHNLCGYNGVWLRTIEDKIPKGAFEGGYSEVEPESPYVDETFYVGRAIFDGHLIPRKVQPSHRACYIAYEEETVSKSAYEILVGLNQSVRHK